ncbi:MAG: hydroxyisourate hydrolase [Candidatus Marinimicrobia bacterium]|jgi:5-hydroxyisourate hydrolase|nr:hydroxyisourate hydrolase [Candidatus Neomarinimicrobiota bacterium]|tara:strand:- start:196 stop:546 length:351 start_codon:yes stop_codon:yes gene_type:complete
MTKLTTHVLDVFSGKPGKDIKVDLYFIEGQKKVKINSLQLNNDGRADKPLVENENFKVGKYELVFFVGEYFKNITDLDPIPFLDEVVIRFGISNNKEHYHVPLLVSPWSYSTYRGS